MEVDAGGGRWKMAEEGVMGGQGGSAGALWGGRSYVTALVGTLISFPVILTHTYTHIHIHTHHSTRTEDGVTRQRGTCERTTAKKKKEGRTESKERSQESIRQEEEQDPGRRKRCCVLC
ncbi:unnamed protein product [Pleuronectes platessa]|uniref:Uncharacterized protein n=1 Tax=Pleuronectes platessa TaxID=8262 RepID=A0A9N7UAA3_PLEPL|nr:unnamed protein product [Pleuronectes platessa]